MTCQIANMLKNHGVKKEDRVCLYLPNCPLAAATMLACSRIGAVHRYVILKFRSYDINLALLLFTKIIFMQAHAICSSFNFCPFSVVFAGFSAEALANRITDGE